MDFVGKSISFSQYIGWIITPTVPVWQDNSSQFGKFFQKQVSRDEVFPLNIACFPDMYFLPPSVLMTGTFFHFLRNCLPTVPSSGGIPSRPAFVPGGQFPTNRSLFYKERVSAGPLFPVVVLFCLRRVTFCRYWQKVTRRRHVPPVEQQVPSITQCSGSDNRNTPIPRLGGI